MKRFSGINALVRCGFAVGVSAIALAAAPAFADGANTATGSDTTTNNTSNNTVQEIVVTAQFRSQKLQDTPIAITALTGASLEQRSAVTLSDATNSAPSVYLREQTPAFGDSIAASIRGLGQGDFDPAMEPGVGIYIDDVYYPRLTGANLDLMDVDRVEVLRGPQGTLTGKNSEGGAIKFFSKMPNGDTGGYLSGTYGRFNRINLKGSADFKLADGLYGRLSGAYASQDGYVNVYDYGCVHPGQGIPNTVGGTNCLKYKEGDVGYQAIRGILRYNPDDKLDVTVSGDYTHDSHHNAAQVLLYANNANPNVAIDGVPFDSRFICGRFCNYDSTSTPAASFVAGAIPALNGYPMQAVSGSELTTLTSWGVSGDIKYNINQNIKLTSITAYRAFDNNFTADDNLSPNPVNFGNNNVTDWSFSQELRLNAKLNSMIDATLGGYFSNEKAVYYTLEDIRYVAVDLPNGVVLPVEPLQFIGNDPIKTDSRAIYGNLQFKPLDKLTINAGLRYTHDTKTYTFVRLNLDGVTPNPFLPLNGIPPGNYSGNRLDYRVAVDYRFSPQVMAYATVATGYKAGGINPRPFAASQVVPFGAEKVTNYEIGTKTDLFDRKLRINLDAFYLDFKNAQLTLLSCPAFSPGNSPTFPCALPQNAGNAHSKGVELETFLRPAAGWQIDGSLSWQDWKWSCIDPQVVEATTATTCSSDPTIISKISSRPPGMMNWKWSIGAQYEADLGRYGTLTPRIDVNYQGSLIGNVTAAAPGSPSALLGQVDAYTLANLRITWQNPNKDLDIAFEVTNLFDKYYYSSKFDLTTVGAGAITGTPGMPREWAVTIRKKF